MTAISFLSASTRSYVALIPFSSLNLRYFKRCSGARCFYEAIVLNEFDLLQHIPRRKNLDLSRLDEYIQTSLSRHVLYGPSVLHQTYHVLEWAKMLPVAT